MENEARDIRIRPAKVDDVSFVAETVLNAIGAKDITQASVANVAQLCKCDGVLYGWRNTYVAEREGVLLGALVAYDGACYQDLKSETLRLLSRPDAPYCNPGFVAMFKTMEPETFPGEYYVDSLYVVPSARCQGIAKALLRTTMALARCQGVPEIALVVSSDNDNARRVYESLGFRAGEETFLFGEKYLRMRASLNGTF